jgi:hypothetical protein
MIAKQPDMCECCDEHPVWDESRKHGYAYCEECSLESMCPECRSDHSEELDPVYVWDPCPACARRDRDERDRDEHRQAEWEAREGAIDSIASALHAALAPTIELRERHRSASSASRYYLAVDADDDGVYVTVRISDHDAGEFGGYDERTGYAHGREEYELLHTATAEDISEAAKKIDAEISAMRTA